MDEATRCAVDNRPGHWRGAFGAVKWHPVHCESDFTEGFDGTWLGKYRPSVTKTIVKIANPMRVASVVVALHVLLASLFLSPHPGKYAFSACLATIVIWGTLYYLKQHQRSAGIIAGFLLALVVQQIAFHVWRSEFADIWWPLVQFLSLQYVVAGALRSSAG